MSSKRVLIVDAVGARRRLHAFGLRVDDYLCCPIEPELFVERVRAALDSKARNTAVPSRAVGLSLDAASGVARLGERFVTLYPTERRLLEILLANPGQTVPRDLLLFRLWGTKGDLQSRVLDVSVCRLRRAFRKLGCSDAVETVRHHGYRLVPAAHT